MPLSFFVMWTYQAEDFDSTFLNISEFVVCFNNVKTVKI